MRVKRLFLCFRGRGACGEDLACRLNLSPHPPVAAVRFKVVVLLLIHCLLLIHLCVGTLCWFLVLGVRLSDLCFFLKVLCVVCSI